MIQCKHMEGGTQENVSSFAYEVFSCELTATKMEINL